MELSRIGRPLSSATARVAQGYLLALVLALIGCFPVLIAPTLLIAEAGAPVWLGGLVAVVLLLAQVAGIWRGVTWANAARKEDDPARRWERLVVDRIDIGFVDGTFKSLPLHAADLRIEASAGTGWTPVDQYILTATGHDGRPARVLLTNAPRGLFKLITRQPDAALAAMAAVAEQSPHPAGQQTAAQLRWFIGTKSTAKGWSH